MGLLSQHVRKVLLVDENLDPIDASNPLDVTGGGGGTQYTEDAAAAADPVGNAQLLVRQDTPAGLVSADGDNVARRATNYGAAFCQMLDSSGNFIDSFGGGTQYASGAAVSPPTGTVALGWDGTNVIALKTDNAGELQIDILSSALPSGAATAANQLADGHNVTVDNAGGGAAVNIQDGGNSITIDAVSLPLPTGAATSANQQTDALTDIELRATPVPVSGTVSIQEPLSVDDNGGSLTVDAVSLPLPTGASTSANQLPDGHAVTVDNAAGGAAVNIQDGGNSITIDGTVAATQSGAWNITNISGTISLPTGAATAALQLPDGHAVTVDNAAGGAAVNIQDGGNSITIDAASLPLPTGAATAANQLADGHNVTVDNGAGGSAVNIQDGGNTITIDGTVTANQGTKLASGSGWRFTEYGHTAGNPNYYSLIGGFEIPSSVIVDPVTAALCGVNNGALRIGGDEANDAVDAGDPVKIGGKVETADDGPTAVADADRVNAWFHAQGLQHQMNHAHISDEITLSNISTTYNNVTTSANSQDIENPWYRQCELAFDLVHAAAPTDIRFIVQRKIGANYHNVSDGHESYIVYDDVVCASKIYESIQFKAPLGTFRIQVVAAGTDATNTFTVDNATLTMRT